VGHPPPWEVCQREAIQAGELNLVCYSWRTLDTADRRENPLQTGKLVFGTPYEVGKQEFVDDRWGDPKKIPATNGPVSITTPPEKPNFKLKEDGQLVEFMLPYPMHVVDSAEWPSLSCSSARRQLIIYKPMPVQEPYLLKSTIGNEPPDTFCSVIRVGCSLVAPTETYPGAAELWPTVERLCEWIRIKCRHYWLLHGQAGFAATLHASILTQRGKAISQKNVVGYGRNFIVRPLDREIWESIETDLQSNLDPPVSEALYCDALISAFYGDEVKAILEMGVAVEVEITDLLTTLANATPSSPSKKKFLQQKSHLLKFYAKLCEWPQKLGLDGAETFAHPGFPPGWVDSIRELYRLRGSAAHSGKIKSGAMNQHLSSYVYAANALFAYARAQRLNAGLPTYSYPSGRTPYDQMLLFRDGLVSSETNTALGTAE
jgi:hypothetical protein